MEGLLFVLLLTIGGNMVYGGLRDCDESKCHHLITEEMKENAVEFPDAKVIDQLCPDILLFLDCLIEELKTCTGQELEELATSDNKTLSKMFTLTMNFNILVRDLCDQNSDLHRVYIENRDCLVDQVDKYGRSCSADGESVYESFHDAVLQEHEEKPREGIAEKEEDAEEDEGDIPPPGFRFDRRRCMIAGYSVACFSVHLQNECSEEARETFLAALKKLQVLKFDICSEEDVVVLKEDFLEFLSLEGEKKSIFEEAFDFRRKRK